MDELDILDLHIKALAFIEKGWTKKTYARIGYFPVLPDSNNADRWCIIGAYTAASDKEFPILSQPILDDLGFSIDTEVARWND